MNKIVKMERKNWFYSYDMIFEQPISAYAKVIYVYLCRCADSDGKSFPSHQTIGLKCSIKSRQTVINAIKQLEQIGLLEKEIRFTDKGGQTSNLYFIYDTPQNMDVCHAPTVQEMDTPCLLNGHPPVHLIDTPCPLNGHPPVQEMDTPCTGNGHEVLPNKGLFIKGLHNEGEGGGSPSPLQKTFGEFMEVRLNDIDYDTLVKKYGEAKTNDYIAQLDNAFAAGRVEHRKNENHRATIENWITRDGKKDSAAQNQKAKPKVNRFVNFKQRDWDYEELERLERQHIMDSIKKPEN